jgi:adenylate cyclase
MGSRPDHGDARVLTAVGPGRSQQTNPPEEEAAAMNESESNPPPLTFQQRYTQLRETVERPAEERPTVDRIDAIAEWLVGPARRLGSSVIAFDEFSWRMLATGLPLLRTTMHGGTLHPLFFGATFVWWRTTGQTQMMLVAHEARDSTGFQLNPVIRVREGGETLRRRIEGAAEEFDFPVLYDLKAAGATDYLALPVASAFGGNYAVTFVSDRAGGFSDGEVADMTRVAQRLPVVMDMHSLRAIANNLLTAYLGPATGPRVLAGQIRRGQSETITAVLWSSDLRGFTARSDRLPGERMIAILNALFDAQARSIHAHGGEILKFIGDGLLAIFPIIDAGLAGIATRNALAAANETLETVRRLSDDPLLSGEPPLKIVVALHVGQVLYGNIGAADRLDFTVIGPAVNLVSRVEAVAKALDLPIVVSDDFARAYGNTLTSLGHHQLRGLASPHELFTPAER